MPAPPRKDLTLVLAASTAIAALALLAVEARWTDAGYRPSVVDTMDLWAFHRSRVYAGRRDHVVLLGTSLMQLAFSVDTFREAYPERQVAQLAISAQFPMAALRDLARDPDFEGIAIVEVHEGAIPREAWDQQEDFVAYHRVRYPAYHELECPLVASLQERLVILNHHYPLANVVTRLARGHSAPPPFFMTMDADRSCRADYADLPEGHRFRVSEDQRRRAQEERPPAPESWLDDAAEIDEWTRDIRARGGKVAFVRFPAEGAIASTDEHLYPRDAYWDRLAERCSATLIDGREVSTLQAFPLPDQLHLDHRDAPAFTRALLTELARRDVLPPPRAPRH